MSNILADRWYEPGQRVVTFNPVVKDTAGLWCVQVLEAVPTDVEGELRLEWVYSLAKAGTPNAMYRSLSDGDFGPLFRYISARPDDTVLTKAAWVQRQLAGIE